MTIFYTSFISDLGKIDIYEEDAYIIRLIINDQGSFKQEAQYFESPCLARAKEELLEYFQGDRYYFSLKLKAEGTDFQKSVWQELGNIAYGQSKSYGELAQALGRPKAYRAVGNANGKNPIPIFIPCHRVLGQGQVLGGYSSGLKVKEKLLRLEGIDFKP